MLSLFVVAALHFTPPQHRVLQRPPTQHTLSLFLARSVSLFSFYSDDDAFALFAAFRFAASRRVVLFVVVVFLAICLFWLVL